MGDVLDETFRLWRRHFRVFLLTVALPTVPLTVVSYAITSRALDASGVRDPGFASHPERLLDSPAMIALNALSVLSLAIALIIDLAVARVAADILLGRAPSVRQAYGKLLLRSWLVIRTVVSAGVASC